MFNAKTTFILGAGASWHYGYSTGEELVKKVIQKAAYLCEYLEFSAAASHNVLPDFLERPSPKATGSRLR